MEYYSAIKRNEIMPFSTTCMNLEKNLSSEVCQIEKDKYHVISHMWNFKNSTNKFIYKAEIE